MQMTRLVAVSVAFALATNVQTMSNDAQHFKKGMELFKNKRYDTQRLWKVQLCRWLITYSISDSKKHQYSVGKFYILCFQKKTFWFAELILEIRGCFHRNMCLMLSGTCLRSLCVTSNVLKSVHRMTECFLLETLEAVKIVIFYIGKRISL